MLERYIQDLLFRYDLVIIPGFGGIIARKKSARYNRKTHLFSPPFKDLSFNASLTESDGLLVSYVASVLETSHQKAEEVIRQQVEVWKNELEIKKRIVIANIGIFSWINNRVIFQPLLTKNYLPEAYGLHSFTREPLDKEILEEKQLTYNINHKNQKTVEDYFFENQNEEKKSPNNILKYAVIAVVGLALLGGGAYYFIGGKTNDNENYQKATFVVKKDMPAVEVDSSSENNTPENPNVSDSVADNNQENNMEENQGSNENPETQPAGENTEIDQSSETTAYDNNSETDEVINTNNNIAQKKYQLIVGAFQEEANAQKKVDELMQQGFNAAITGQNSRGLYMVAIDAFDNFNDAKNKLNELHANYPDLWIYVIK